MSVPAVAPLLGQLSPFNPEEEIISAYLERANIFFDANKIEDDKQRVTLQTTLNLPLCFL